MVKRMVALSATGHGVAKNVLNGLPEKLNYITISDEIVFSSFCINNSNFIYSTPYYHTYYDILKQRKNLMFPIKLHK